MALGATKVQVMKATTWQEMELNERIGLLYRQFLTKGNLTSTLNYAVKLMCDQNSKYAIAPDGSITAWRFIGAMTQYITDKAFVNVAPAKTIEVIEAVAPEFLTTPEATNGSHI